MHIAQTLATYSFGLDSFLNVLDSEVIPNKQQTLVIFYPQCHTGTSTEAWASDQVQRYGLFGKSANFKGKKRSCYMNYAAYRGVVNKKSNDFLHHAYVILNFAEK
jgi:hypothetical protein